MGGGSLQGKPLVVSELWAWHLRSSWPNSKLLSLPYDLSSHLSKLGRSLAGKTWGCACTCAKQANICREQVQLRTKSRVLCNSVCKS